MRDKTKTSLTFLWQITYIKKKDKEVVWAVFAVNSTFFPTSKGISMCSDPVFPSGRTLGGGATSPRSFRYV